VLSRESKKMAGLKQPFGGVQPEKKKIVKEKKEGKKALEEVCSTRKKEGNLPGGAKGKSVASRKRGNGRTI